MAKKVFPEQIKNVFDIFINDLFDYSEKVKEGDELFSASKKVTDKVLAFINWINTNPDKVKFFDLKMLTFSRLINYMTKYGLKIVEDNNLDFERIDENYILATVSLCLDRMAFDDKYDNIKKDCQLIERFFMSCFNYPKYSNELLKDFYELCIEEDLNHLLVIFYSYEYISNNKSVSGDIPKDVSINDLYKKNEAITDILDKTISFYPSFLNMIHCCKSDDEKKELWNRFMDLKFFVDIHSMIKNHLSNVEPFFYKYRNNNEIIINEEYTEKFEKLKKYILQFLEHHGIINAEEDFDKKNIIPKIEQLYKRIKKEKEMEFEAIIPYKHMVYQFVINEELDDFESLLETFDWYIRLYNIMLIHLSCFAAIFYVEGNDSPLKLAHNIYDDIKEQYGTLEVTDRIQMISISDFMNKMLY